MTIQRLIELLKALVDTGAIDEDTEVMVDVPDEDFFTVEMVVSGVTVYNNGSVVLKVTEGENYGTVQEHIN